MDINQLSREWSYSRIRDIRSILSAKKINKTGKLSKSLKIKLIGGTNPRIDFYWVYYGKYVRAHYLKKGIDILAPLKGIEQLTKKISVEMKKQIIEDIKQNLKQQ